MIYVCLFHRHTLHALGIQKRFQLLPGYPVLSAYQVVFQTAVLDEVQSLVIGERKNVSDILRSEIGYGNKFSRKRWESRRYA